MLMKSICTVQVTIRCFICGIIHVGAWWLLFCRRKWSPVEDLCNFFCNDCQTFSRTIPQKWVKTKSRYKDRMEIETHRKILISPLWFNAFVFCKNSYNLWGNSFIKCWDIDTCMLWISMRKTNQSEQKCAFLGIVSFIHTCMSLFLPKYEIFLGSIKFPTI